MAQHQRNKKFTKKVTPAPESYGDEGDLTHYLGNDDYRNTNEFEDEKRENEKLQGREARGNEDMLQRD